MTGKLLKGKSGPTAVHTRIGRVLSGPVPLPDQSQSSVYLIMMTHALRPLTPGKRFLLFLPDSHSAYYDSSVSALGQSLPPSLGLSMICCTWSSFWRKRQVGRGGGWWDHPPALATLGKMALGTSVGFHSIGWSD